MHRITLTSEKCAAQLAPKDIWLTSSRETWAAEGNSLEEIPQLLDLRRSCMLVSMTPGSSHLAVPGVVALMKSIARNKADLPIE